MTTNEAFEATYPVPDGIWFHSDGDYINKDDTPNEYNNMWHTWQSATTESNKRIKELESEVAIARSNENHADDQRIKCIRKYKTQITELQASNNILREALEVCKYDCNTGEVIGIAREALAATPAESLQDFKNELVEKCEDIANYMPLNADEIHKYRASDDSKAMAWDIYHAIRALKEVK